MSISIIATPSGTPGLPVRMEQWIELESDDGLISAATVAEFELTVLSTVAAGNTVTVIWPNGNVVMTASATPDDSGTEFSSVPATVTLLTTELYNRVVQNYYLQRDFIIYRSATDKILFTSRKAGAGYHPSLLDTDPGGIGSWATVTAGVDAVYEPNYTLNLAVDVAELPNSSVLTRLPEKTGRRDADGRVRFEVASLLLPYVGYTWPDYGATAATLAYDLFRQYKLWVYESYGSPPEPRFMVALGNGRIWYAGSRHEEYDLWQSEMLWSEVLGGAYSRWLTYRGRGDSKHEVSTGQQHYLAWRRYNPGYTSGDTIRLRAEVYYTDSTSTATTAYAVLLDDIPSNIVLFPTGFDILDLGSLQPTKTPYKYRVWLTSVGSGTALINEYHDFWLVPEDANELHLEFVNSMGGIESLRCIGRWEKGLELSKDDANITRMLNEGLRPSTQQTDTVNVNQRVQETVQLTSGYVDKNELVAALDVLFSPELRMVNHSLATRKGHRLLNTTHVVRRQGDPGEHLYALNLELAAGDPERGWSNMNVWPSAF